MARVAQVEGEDQSTMDSLDEEVRADVEAAAKILSRRLASRCPIRSQPIA